MVLKTLSVKNFTVFHETNVEFGPGINVVVGANGAGKSHLLKLAYTAAAASYQAKQEKKTRKPAFVSVLQEKLMDVFRAERLENLVYGRSYPNKAQVSVVFDKPDDTNISFSLKYPSEKKTTAVNLEIVKHPTQFLETSPVFIPTREILSIIPAFSKLHREKELLLDGTYFDLSFLVQMANLSDLRPELTKIVSQLNDLLEGTVIQEGGRFYLQSKLQPDFKLEMPLVAEGLRKIAMLCCLLQNGAIQPRTILLWDEPEANLNPALMVGLAEILVRLSALDMQVIVATHSLFFLREIHICLSNTKSKGRFFALDKTNETIRLSQSDSVDEIEPIAALDADMKQTDRYMALED